MNKVKPILKLGFKTCTGCQTEKTVDGFYRQNRKLEGSTQGRMAKCKVCVDAYASAPRVKERQRRRRVTPGSKTHERLKEYRATPERKEKAQVWQRARNHGLTSGAFDKLFADQEGTCAICKEQLVLVGKTGLHVDHDHKTLEVRGLLCAKCNRGLGCFEDNTSYLKSAITYLERK